MSDLFDLSFRPETYFPESPNRKQLLAKIQGQARREIVESQLETEGFQSLDDFIARPELTEDQLKYWGRIHPWAMGGEYLPVFEETEVEIARVSLQSVTFDQISVRAEDYGDSIRLSVVDEYDTEFDLPFEMVAEPLTFGELVDFLDNTTSVGYIGGKGLVTGHWWAQYISDNHSIEEATDFASIESAFYPDLKAYYRTYTHTWIEANQSRLPEGESFWDDALKMLDRQEKEHKSRLQEKLETAS